MKQQTKIKMSSEIQKQFILTSKIGNGNFSTVYLAKHIETQQIVAIKTMKNHIPIAVKQAQILKKINHPNVIKLYKFQKPKHKEEALMVLQYVPQNILQLYQAQQYGLKQQQVKCILFQACLGLYHIHQKGIIHRDIKPQNIMIHRNKAEVKLIDFGLAIQQASCVTDYVATRWYRAPQNLLGTKQYTVSIDIFSLGCVIVQLYTGNPLFPGSNNVDQICKILTMMGEPSINSWKKGYEMFIKLGLNFHIKPEKKNKTLRNIMSSCSEGLMRIVQRMLILNPFKRITAQQILKDTYFNGIQKIIPPRVYQQYLIDIKRNKMNFVRQISRNDTKNDVKQRVRFLSEQKGFGAFSSFKSGSVPNKLQNLISSTKNSTQSLINTTNQIKRRSYLEIQDENKKNQTNKSLITLSHESNRPLNINKSQQKIIAHSNDNHSFFKGEIPSNIKSSIQNYQQNLLKLSTSLQNMKNLNNFSSSQMQTKINQQNLSKNNCKSLEMLSFRGFNQPKQRFQPVKQSNQFLSKKNQLEKQFPKKSKKVMEYLQKFQNFTSKKQEGSERYIKKQPHSYMHESMNHHSNTPKKSSFLSFESQNKSFLAKQSIKIKDKQDNHFSEKKENDQFYQTKQFSSSGVLQQNNQILYPIIRRNDTTNQNNQRLQNYRSEMNSASIEKSYRTQFKKESDTPTKNMNPILKIKFNQSNSETYVHQSNSKKSQNKIIPLNESYNFHAEKSYLVSPSKKSQKQYLQQQSLESLKRKLYESTRASNLQSMNLSSNRPIENKIKMVSVRDQITDDCQKRQKFVSCSFQNYEKSKYFKCPVQNQIASQNLKFTKNRGIDQVSLINSHTSFHSPRIQHENQSKFMQNQSQLLPSDSIKLLNQSRPKVKYFKSTLQQQNSSYKSAYKSPYISPERSSMNSSQSQFEKSKKYGFASIKNKNSYQIEPNHQQIQNTCYIPVRQYKGFELQKQLKMAQKPSQTALSQLRQSITGLTKTLNEGTFLSQRSQKYANKNININLNLNIFEQKSHRKK